VGYPAHTLLPGNRHGRPANAEMAHEEERCAESESTLF